MTSEPTSSSFEFFPSDTLSRNLKQLKKTLKGSREQTAFLELLAKVIEVVCSDPTKIRGHEVLKKLEPEPWPGKHKGNEHNLLWKAYFHLPWERGARREARLLYIIHPLEERITGLMLYTHAEYQGRPNDGYLQDVLKESGIPRSKPEDNPDPSTS